jgi:DNA primase
MDVVQLKEYILDNNLIETILEEIGCHHIVYHSSSAYWSAANYDGDNKQGVIIRKNEYALHLKA